MNVAVVICCYTSARWDDVVAALSALAGQTRPADEVLVVVDHNPQLLQQATDVLRRVLPGVRVMPSTGPRGLSGARNTGVAAASADIVAFLDDDACPEPGWLAALVAPYEDPAVVGTGGTVLPRWPGERPGWFPQEFDWVVGCSYAGLPSTPAPIRNPIGASMSFRREVLTTGPSDTAFDTGPFSTALGRVGTLPLGCEETELAIRVHAERPDSRICYAPASVVRHRISIDRTRVRYFVRRCWGEGLSKAAVVRSVGAAGLAAERAHVMRALPRGVVRAFRAHRPDRAGALLLGLLVTTAGYAVGRLWPLPRTSR
ncbi:MAG TPA: glycosyltransferase family 2 protein [Mycobacteriales bacterium]|nr:glycosyltransferase family 2 protein [Mycobacteriales bacterium]